MGAIVIYVPAPENSPKPCSTSLIARGPMVLGGRCCFHAPQLTGDWSCGVRANNDRVYRHSHMRDENNPFGSKGGSEARPVTLTDGENSGPDLDPYSTQKENGFKTARTTGLTIKGEGTRKNGDSIYDCKSLEWWTKLS